MVVATRCLLRIVITLLLLLGEKAPAMAGPPPGALVWSTYLGGTLDEAEPSLTLDAQGQAYVAATTASSDFPAVTGPAAWPEENEDFFLDMSIARLSPGGAILWSGYMGYQDVNEILEDLALGPEGDVRLAGWVTAYDEEVMVDRFTADGPGPLYYDLYLGEGLDLGQAIAVDPQGNSYVTGFSNSYWFPTIQPNQGPAGPFVLKLDPAMGFLGVFFLPRELGVPSAIARDAAGNLYLTGKDPEWNLGTGDDVWVAKLAPAGTLLWTVHLGGSQREASRAIAVDPAGRIWVAGWTESPDFPVRGGRPYAGGRDAFLARLTPGGELAASTLLGGTGPDEAGDLALDNRGIPFLAGTTASAGFPLVAPLAEGCGGTCGGTNAFAAVLEPSTLNLTFSTLLGGSGEDGAHTLAVDPFGSSIWVSGLTGSPDFPTRDAWQPELAGGTDLFVTRIALNRHPDCAWAFASPAILGPPYGWFRTVTVQGVTDPEGDRITAVVTRITQDELLSRPGQPDARGVGTTRPMVRADRLSSGDGRVYHLTFTASDTAGATCTGRVTVCVPVDPSRPTCRDGGARFDSSGF